MTSEQILKSDMLDILFDGRNKAYGAYETRRNYDKDLARALFVGVLITLSFFGYSAYNEKYGMEKAIIPEDIIYEISEHFVFPTAEVPPLEIESIKQNQAITSTVTYTAPAVVSRPASETAIASTTQLEHENPGVTTQAGIDSGPVSIDPTSGTDPGLQGDVTPGVTETKEDNTIRNYVEQMPEFPGGISALMQWLAENLVYPTEAVRNGFTGKVITQFTVEKDGSVTNVKIIRDGVGGGAGEEAARIVGKMPKWVAGFQNNKPVRVLYTLPIFFSLR